MTTKMNYGKMDSVQVNVCFLIILNRICLIADSSSMAFIWNRNMNMIGAKIGATNTLLQTNFLEKIEKNFWDEFLWQKN